MLGIELTEKQKKIWNEMSDHLLATPQIKHLSLQYYLQYRENLQKHKLSTDDADKINNLFQIAYFISQKNQVTYNMRGERVAGVTFSVNQIIKKNSNFQDFIFHMKEMLKVITIDDKFVQQEIQTCLKKFKFTMTFHHKFVSTFKKIKPPLPQPQLQLSQSLLWLIFILTKQNMAPQNQNDIIEITCLIASVFIFYIEECIKSTCLEFELDDANYGGVLRKESITHVFLEYFRLKDMGKFQEVLGFFRGQVADLRDLAGFQCFFGERNLENAYRKIDSLYMKRMTDANLDQRHFLKQRINTVMNANRFTPFGGRRAGPKSKTTHIPNQILSHRVLNYQKQQQSKTFEPQPKQPQPQPGPTLLKKLAQNKTPAQKTPLIKATPITNAMQMHNWLLQKTNYHKYDHTEISRFIKGEEKQLKLMHGLWKDICLNQVEKGVELGDEGRMAVLALAAQVVYFVMNSSQGFQRVIGELGIGWFQVWAKIDCVLSYDTRMPISIKIHLLGVQTVLISKQLWRKQQPYSSIFKDPQSRSQKPELDRLYRRVIHQIVYQTYFLCKKLNFSDQSMNSIFFLSQYVICENTDLLLHRTLYQIVLCSAYAVCKTQDLETSFYSLLIAFQDLNGMGKEDYHELTEMIWVDGKEPIDIITFYNQEFVKRTKPVLIQMKCQSTNAIYSMANRKNLISSPVKELLPRNVIALGDRTNKSQLQTPMTIALQAYHESPLLRQRRIKNLANCVDGKRILQKKTDHSKEQTLKQTSMLINQKWRNTKSPEQKLNTTVKKGCVSHENMQN